MADWSKLPEDLLLLITLRLFSVVELLHFRSICKSWRSSITIPNNNNNLSLLQPLIHLNPLIITTEQKNSNAYLSRAAFFRVTLFSTTSPTKSWLIKTEPDFTYGTFRLLNPLTRLPLLHWYKSIDLYQFTLLGVQESYALQDFQTKETLPGFKKLLVLGQEPRVVVGLGCDRKIRYWNGVVWTRIKEQTSEFCDVIVHRGLTYVLDTKGVVWLVSGSFGLLKYGLSLDWNVTSEKRFVECSGVLYIVDPLHVSSVVTVFSHVLRDDVGDTNCVCSEKECNKVVGFKVYKVDEEVGRWVVVESLGGYAIVIATDCCFSVLADEYYGCLRDSIYFTDKERVIKVFKMDDGSVTTMKGFAQSCFQMFVPSFR